MLVFHFELIKIVVSSESPLNILRILVTFAVLKLVRSRRVIPEQFFI